MNVNVYTRASLAFRRAGAVSTAAAAAAAADVVRTDAGQSAPGKHNGPLVPYDDRKNVDDLTDWTYADRRRSTAGNVRLDLTVCRSVRWLLSSLSRHLAVAGSVSRHVTSRRTLSPCRTHCCARVSLLSSVRRQVRTTTVQLVSQSSQSLSSTCTCTGYMPRPPSNVRVAATGKLNVLERRTRGPSSR